MQSAPVTNNIPTAAPYDNLNAAQVRRMTSSDGSSLQQYENEYQKLNCSYQTVWDETMRDFPSRRSEPYEKAAVLLLSWEQDYDDLDVQEEVESLESIFMNTFRYDVYKVFLNSNNDRSAQAQVNLELATFVAREDRPKKLLIVYYAGHGTQGASPGYLELSPGFPSVHNFSGNLNKVVWNRAETLLQDTRADILEIFDCCYAGSLGMRFPSGQVFEYIAATGSSDITKCPGPTSFTSALIWALKRLVEEQGCFTTQQLLQKIKKEAPNFPHDQTPSLSKRADRNPENFIVLEPITSKEDSSKLAQLRSRSFLDTGTAEALTLRVMFDSRPTLDDVKRLGKALNEVMEDPAFRVSSIKWDGLRPAKGVVSNAECNPIESSRHQLQLSRSHSTSKSSAIPPNGQPTSEIDDSLLPGDCNGHDSLHKQ